MIRLVIADDQALVRAGLRGLLELAGDFEVVAEAADGAQAIECTQRQHPDLLLLDVRMPAGSGIEVLRELKRQGPLPPTLLLTTFDDDEALLEGMRAGAHRFQQPVYPVRPRGRNRDAHRDDEGAGPQRFRGAPDRQRDGARAFVLAGTGVAGVPSLLTPHSRGPADGRRPMPDERHPRETGIPCGLAIMISR